MKKSNKYKLIIIIISIFLLTGCGDKSLKDENNKVVKNEQTGQVLKTDIICQPTDEESIQLYEKYNVDISKLPKCENFSPLNNYEGLWTSIFVKPLAWFIIQIGKLVKNYGLAVILSCLAIRLLLMPITKKTAVQSENMKKAQPELNKLEKKYANKTSEDDQMKKAQEMMLIYQKYQINPVSGCLLAFIQIPLLIAYYSAINRTPAIFEDSFLGLKLGITPIIGIKSGNYLYLLLVVLIGTVTFFSFKKTMKDQSTLGDQMKYSLYFMLALILISSFQTPSAIGEYWITSSAFTIIQNLLVERKKEK